MTNKVVRFSTLGRELQIGVKGLNDEAARRKLAIGARAEKRRVLAEQRARSGVEPGVVTAVNGREGAAEETVRLPGPITYQFFYGVEVGTFLLAFLEHRSPELSGEYKRSHRLIVGGAYANVKDLGRVEAFTVVNTVPYSRKLEVGAVDARVPPHIYEDARQAAQARYGRIAKFSMRYIEIAGGYVLKGNQRTRLAARNARSSAHRAGRTTLSSRADLRAGQPLLYPSIYVEMRT